MSDNPNSDNLKEFEPSINPLDLLFEQADILEFKQRGAYTEIIGWKVRQNWKSPHQIVVG